MAHHWLAYGYPGQHPGKKQVLKVGLSKILIQRKNHKLTRLKTVLKSVFLLLLYGLLYLLSSDLHFNKFWSATFKIQNYFCVNVSVDLKIFMTCVLIPLTLRLENGPNFLYGGLGYKSKGWWRTHLDNFSWNDQFINFCPFYWSTATSTMIQTS